MIRTLGPGSLTIGAAGSPRQFGAHVTNIVLTPSTDSDDDIYLLDGSTEDGQDTTTYELSGKLLQAYDFDSLETFIFNNRGQKLPFVFIPANNGGQSWSGIVKIRPVEIGGDVKKKNTTDFKFPLVGDPTLAEHHSS